MSDVIVFAGLTLLVVITAWESVPRYVARRLAGHNVRFVTVVSAFWGAVLIAFGLTLGRTTNAWPLLAVLTEIAGVTMLAREVHIAQETEEHTRLAAAVRPFIDLEPLVEAGRYEEYFRAYYQLDGCATEEVDLRTQVVKAGGTLESQVRQLREGARRAFQRPSALRSRRIGTDVTASCAA